MIRFEKLSPTENYYPFTAAKTAGAYVNGTMGTFSSGTFTAGAGTFVLMNEEAGDKEYYDDFTVEAGADARIADISSAELDGKVVNITKINFPASFDEGDMLVGAASTGALSVDGEATSGYQVIEKTTYGCRAKIVVGA